MPVTGQSWVGTPLWGLPPKTQSLWAKQQSQAPHFIDSLFSFSFLTSNDYTHTIYQIGLWMTFGSFQKSLNPLPSMVPIPHSTPNDDLALEGETHSSCATKWSVTVLKQCVVGGSCPILWAQLELYYQIAGSISDLIHQRKKKPIREVDRVKGKVGISSQVRFSWAGMLAAEEWSRELPLTHIFVPAGLSKALFVSLDKDLLRCWGGQSRLKLPRLVFECFYLDLDSSCLSF